MNYEFLAKLFIVILLLVYLILFNRRRRVNKLQVFDRMHVNETGLKMIPGTNDSGIHPEWDNDGGRIPTDAEGEE
jgi:hypothetical protein